MKVVITLIILVIWALIANVTGWWQTLYLTVLGGAIFAIPLYCMLTVLFDVVAFVWRMMWRPWSRHL